MITQLTPAAPTGHGTHRRRLGAALPPRRAVHRRARRSGCISATASPSAKGGGIRTASPDPNDPYGTIPTEQLSADANTLLVAADDSLKTSEQELTFATAQYGAGADRASSRRRWSSPGPTSRRRSTCGSCSTTTAADDEPTKRGWFAQIIERCRAADARLDAQVEAFDKLRDLEANVETMIPALAARRDAAAGRLPQTQATHVRSNAIRAVGDARRLEQRGADRGADRLRRPDARPGRRGVAPVTGRARRSPYGRPRKRWARST